MKDESVMTLGSAIQNLHSLENLSLNFSWYKTKVYEYKIDYIFRNYRHKFEYLLTKLLSGISKNRCLKSLTMLFDG